MMAVTVPAVEEKRRSCCVLVLWSCSVVKELSKGYCWSFGAKWSLLMAHARRRWRLLSKTEEEIAAVFAAASDVDRGAAAVELWRRCCPGVGQKMGAKRRSPAAYARAGRVVAERRKKMQRSWAAVLFCREERRAGLSWGRAGRRKG